MMRRSSGIDWCPPQARDGALLQEAQQRHLAFQRQVADLVEKKRAALGLLDPADLALVRAGEGTLLVAEQFGLHQMGRDGSAVDGDERSLAPARCFVDGLRRKLLAGARLARDEDGRFVMRDLGERAEHGPHRRAVADHLAVADGLADLPAVQARHAMRVLERVEQVVERERRAHVIDAIVADQAPHALVVQHAAVGDGHPRDLRMLQALLEQHVLGIAVVGLQVDHAGHRRAGAHDALELAQLVHVPDIPAGAELRSFDTVVFMARHDQHLRGACRSLA